MTQEISVVIPAYNEGENLPELHRRLIQVLKKVSKKYEIIFVNDGSTDNSLDIMKKLRAKNKKVKIISFSRNFGHMPAINAGISYSTGDKIVIMDADLQDPPEIINKMYQKSKEGFDVVYGTKTKRKESTVRKFYFKIFYVLFNKISSYKMPLDAGTFSLIDKKVAHVLISLPERNKYFSGLRFWAGFSQTGVVYERAARFHGKEASFKRLFKLALDGLFSFSYIPLRLSSIFGFLFAFISFIFIVVVLIGRLVFGLGIVGWASTISSVLFIGGIQLITLGIIGEYLARIYDEVKGRPEYIISEKLGFGKN